jgi:hypothetical protein
LGSSSPRDPVQEGGGGRGFRAGGCCFCSRRLEQWGRCEVGGPFGGKRSPGRCGWKAVAVASRERMARRASIGSEGVGVVGFGREG